MYTGRTRSRRIFGIELALTASSHRGAEKHDDMKDDPDDDCSCVGSAWKSLEAAFLKCIQRPRPSVRGVE